MPLGMASLRGHRSQGHLWEDTAMYQAESLCEGPVSGWGGFLNTQVSPWYWGGLHISPKLTLISTECQLD